MLVLTVLPALSVQLPATVALGASGPAYVIAGVHEAMPEKAAPANEKETGWLYQPLQSGARAGATVAVGDDSSTFTRYTVVAVYVVAPLDHVTVQ
jgi:hypothetical protein